MISQNFLIKVPTVENVQVTVRQKLSQSPRPRRNINGRDQGFFLNWNFLFFKPEMDQGGKVDPLRAFLHKWKEYVGCLFQKSFQTFNSHKLQH